MHVLIVMLEVLMMHEIFGVLVVYVVFEMLLMFVAFGVPVLSARCGVLMAFGVPVVWYLGC